MKSILLTAALVLWSVFSVKADQETTQKLSALFQSVQNGGGSDILKTTRSILKLAIGGDPAFSTAALKSNSDQSGVLIYTGVYGPPGNRIVRILLFADFTKWPKEDVVGKLTKVKSWYYDYDKALTLAAKITDRLGGYGAIYNGMKIIQEQAQGDYVAIFLVSTDQAPPPLLQNEVTSAELDFYH